MKTVIKKVLIIDDDPEYVDMLKGSIKESHFRCIAAFSASEGIKKAIEFGPDLILLDLMMPKMSGFGFLRETKRNESLANIPIVVLTGIGDEEVAKESIELGAVDYITKDCDQDELMRLVWQYTST